MEFQNLLVGLTVFLIIGVFHPIVIKAEYYWGKRVWPAFAAAGVLFAGLSLCSEGIPGVLLAVLSCTCFWSIQEVIEQDARVEKGWFPAGKTHQIQHQEVRKQEGGLP